MRDFLRGRGGLIAKLSLLCLVALSLLPLGCSQGGTVAGEVRYKMITGMKVPLYFIIVRNEPTDGEPSIVFDKAAEEEIKTCFPSTSTGNLTVDNSTEKQIEAFYTRIDYIVSIQLMSGERDKYYQAFRADREDFNKMAVGSRVRVDTIPSSEGPRIVRIVG
jgi:hypothetical protein